MCIELHKPSAESLRELVKIEDESKFVPSQFERGSVAEIVRDCADKMYAEGFELAKLRISRLLLAHDFALYSKLAQQIEELKP